MFLKLIEVITSTMFSRKMLLLNCSVPANSKNASGKRQNSWGKKWTRSWSSTCFWLLKIFNCFSSFESNGEVLGICILIVKAKDTNLLPTGAHTDGENEWKLDPLRSALPTATAAAGELRVSPCCLPEVWRYMGNGKSQKQLLTLRKISCSASLQHLINHKKFIAVYTPVPETLSPN